MVGRNSRKGPSSLSADRVSHNRLFARKRRSVSEAGDTLQHHEAIRYSPGPSVKTRYGGYVGRRCRWWAEGESPLDAFIVQEQLVIYFNSNTAGERLVALYPEEGTFWMDHPLVLLEGNWVTERQRRTFGQFAEWVTKPEQKRLVLQQGYRTEEAPVSPQETDSLIRLEHGVNPTEPKTALEVPSPEILERIRDVWRLLKKPANIYLVADVSGSMAGEKLSAAKTALNAFIDQMQGDRDRVALVAFSNDVREIETLGKLDRQSFKAKIDRLDARGGTELYNAVAFAFDRLQQQADPKRINVIVAMTDGISIGNIDIIESKLKVATTPVMIFTVGYGEEADLDVLRRIARLGDGQVYPSDPETIEKLYELLSAFF